MSQFTEERSIHVGFRGRTSGYTISKQFLSLVGGYSHCRTLELKRRI